MTPTRASADSVESKPSRWWIVAIVSSVGVISVLHYITSHRSVPLHEVFQRLYHLPIVVASVVYGARGGLAAAGLSAVLFLPHVILSWHAWPLRLTSQYAEVAIFALVGGVTGLLADRLHAERDRCHRTAIQLDHTCRRLEASIDERVRADRLVTIGRVASGIAHEVRNPLGGLLGSLEILGADIPQGHPKTEFLAIAKKEIERLNRVVTDFLDFAHPPSPATRPAAISSVVEVAAGLASPALALRGATLHVETKAAPPAEVDVDQVERALLNLVLDEMPLPLGADVRIASDSSDTSARIIVSRPLSGTCPGCDISELFEPFHESGQSAGLALAVARRLIENQQGTIRAELTPGYLRYVIELPLARSKAAVTDLRDVHAGASGPTLLAG